MADTARERRHYFRIEDKVHLRVKPLSEEEFATLMKRGLAADDEAGGVTAQLRTLTQQMGNTLLNIRKSHTDIAQYLQLLDEKV